MTKGEHGSHGRRAGITQGTYVRVVVDERSNGRMVCPLDTEAFKLANQLRRLDCDVARLLHTRLVPGRRRSPGTDCRAVSLRLGVFVR